MKLFYGNSVNHFYSTTIRTLVDICLILNTLSLHSAVSIKVVQNMRCINYRNRRPNTSEGPCLAFRISQFFGILPFTNEGEFSTALWLRSVCLVTYLVLTVIPAEFYFYCVKMHDKRDVVKKLISTLYFAHRPVDFLMFILHVRTSYRSRRNLKEILVYIMKSQTATIQRNDLTTTFISIWILTADLHFVYFRPWASTNWSEILAYIRKVSLFTSFFCNTFIIALYSAFMVHLEKRLITACLTIKTNGHQAILEHSTILDLCQKIDSCFGTSLLIVILTSTYSIIYTAYFSISLFLSFEDVKYYKISEKVFFVVCLMYLVCYPVSRCEMVKQAAEAFNSELFKVMQDTEDLCKNDKLRLYVSMKPTVHFSACGFFGLGRSLVTSIITATTTYLVILVQFSMD